MNAMQYRLLDWACGQLSDGLPNVNIRIDSSQLDYNIDIIVNVAKACRRWRLDCISE